MENEAKNVLTAKRSYAADVLLNWLVENGRNPGRLDLSRIVTDGLMIHGCPAVSPAELDAIFASVSLTRERQTGRLDNLGRFDEDAITWDISEPWIDLCAQALARSLASDTVARVPNRFKVIITHDLDRTTGFEPTAILNSLLKAGGLRRSACLGLRDSLSPNALVRNIERLLEYERAHAIGAIYFMMAGPYRWGRYAARTDIRWGISQQIAKLVQEAGMTVGLHGGFYAREQSSYTDEKERIEQVLGSRISTHRNHYLRFDTAPICSQLEAAGIEYDFSMGFRARLGFRNGCAHVHRVYDLLRNRTSSLRSVPLIFMDTIFCCSTTQSVLPTLREALVKVRDVRGCVSLLFHPDTILEHPEGWSWFETIIDMCRALGADLTGVLPKFEGYSK